MKHSKGDTAGLIVSGFIFILILLSICLIVSSCVAVNMNPRLASFTVKRVTEVANAGGKYLVFTESDDVYQNDDAWLYGKWDSSDLQSQMDPGECYRAKVTGYRVRFLSWYPNIIELYPCEE